MNPIFVDTSLFIALIDNTDETHAAAQHFAQTNTAPLVTTNAIILELGSYFSKRMVRMGFAAAQRAITRAGIEVMHISPELQERGVQLFISRPDKDWSLTDCISFLIMQDRGITHAATADHHFGQSGFDVLLPITNSPD